MPSTFKSLGMKLFRDLDGEMLFRFIVGSNAVHIKVSDKKYQIYNRTRPAVVILSVNQKVEAVEQVVTVTT